jgi:hypothetical protein
VRAGDPKWCGGFPPLLRLSDQSEGDVGEGNRSQRTSSCVPPAPLHLLYTRSATGAHKHQLVGAPNQDARLNGAETWSHVVERPLGSIQHRAPTWHRWPGPGPPRGRRGPRPPPGRTKRQGLGGHGSAFFPVDCASRSTACGSTSPVTVTSCRSLFTVHLGAVVCCSRPSRGAHSTGI